MPKQISTITGIVIIVTVAIIALGGVVLYLQKSQILMTNVQSNPNVQNSNTETADWKTYGNNEYGFEIKYPFSFSESKYKGVGKNWIVEFKKDQNIGSPSFIAILIGDDVPVIKESAKEKQQIVLNGYKAWQFMREGSNKEYVTIFEKETSPFMVDVYYSLSPTGNDYQQEYNKMLSTFKFTK